MSDELKTFSVPEGTQERMDAFLAGVMDGLSRSRVKQLIQDGDALLNGRRVKPSAAVRAGDVVTAAVPAPQPDAAQPEDIPLDVLYEDADIIVVNKAAGMVTHPAPGSWSGTLVNALLHRCTDLSGVNGALRPGIVHRLDKDTTGVIVAAKNDAAHQSLAKQIEERQMHKEYVALVHGHFPEREGTIETNLARSQRDYRKIVVAPAGRNAVTHYRTIEELGNYSLMDVVIETGRTHQIRVHMAHRGHPVVGDPLYGPSKGYLAGTGQLLHARKLSFVHPRTGEFMEFTAPVPERFDAVLRTMGSSYADELSRGGCVTGTEVLQRV